MVAVIALVRARAVAGLEQRVADLERELALLRESLAGAAPPPAATQRAAVPEAVAAPIAGQAALEPSIESATPPELDTEPAGDSVEPAPRFASAPSLPSFDIDWERWIGVRGAAVLGGVVLALAGLFFFRYSIEHGLIPAWLRVVLGTLVGVSSIAGAEWRLRARYETTANALAGGGVVVLYAAFWAAGVLYHLVATPAAFILMISVTVAASVLSWRYNSLVIALIGVAGGFATPFLLSSGADHPIGLFAYILLLDAGLLYLARQCEWPVLALLSLVATAVYEAMWIVLRMGPERLTLGLVILGLFALVFAIAGRGAPEDERGHWISAQFGGVLFPSSFALYFAADTQYGTHLYPTALLLLPLSVAAGWIARVQSRPMLGLGCAAGDVAVVGVWLLTRQLALPLMWEVAGLSVCFGAVFHAFVELDRDQPSWAGPAPAAIVSAGGLFAILVLALLAVDRATPWPLFVGWSGLAALLVRHGGFVERGWLQVAASVALATGLSLSHLIHAGASGFPPLAMYLAIIVAVGLFFQAIGVARAPSSTEAPEGVGAQPAPAQRWAERAAALFVFIALPPLSSPSMVAAVSPPVLLLTQLLLGLFGAFASARQASGRWLLVAVLVTAFAHTTWTAWYWDVPRGDAVTLAALAAQLAAVAAFTAWPFVAFARFRADRWAWYAAALTPVAWFYPLRQIWIARFGADFIGALPVLLAGVALSAAARARTLWPAAVEQRQRTVVWLLAVALAFTTAAIPLQLEKEWITIGWALEAAALTLLWRRVDHYGLKYIAIALVVGVTIRLVGNPAVLGYYPRPTWRIINWLAYTYLVPAAALLTLAGVLERAELARVREWEAPLYARGYPLGAVIAGLAGLLLIFVWINLAIADWFATGDTLRVSFDRLPARDLTTSIAWACYGLVLLALGVRRSNRGLRWVSLGLMMVTIGKVFLYDLGELRDLYRVASLLGLAISLIAVSLAYQRFVLRKASEEEP